LETKEEEHAPKETPRCRCVCRVLLLSKWEVNMNDFQGVWDSKE